MNYLKKYFYDKCKCGKIKSKQARKCYKCWWKIHKGKNHPNYKDGRTNKIYYCKDCGKKLSISAYQGAKRCLSCSAKRKHQIGILPKKKLTYCKDCKKLITKYAKRCIKCVGKWRSKNIKYLRGKLHWHYKDGKGREPYGIEFTPKLKSLIRQRDNYTCQYCEMKEKDHLKKYNRVLEIHHIDHNRRNNRKSNLITACKQCNINH